MTQYRGKDKRSLLSAAAGLKYTWSLQSLSFFIQEAQLELPFLKWMLHLKNKQTKKHKQIPNLLSLAGHIFIHFLGKIQVNWSCRVTADPGLNLIFSWILLGFNWSCFKEACSLWSAEGNDLDGSITGAGDCWFIPQGEETDTMRQTLERNSEEQICRRAEPRA